MQADAVTVNVNLLKSKTEFRHFISKIHRMSSVDKFKLNKAGKSRRGCRALARP